MKIVNWRTIKFSLLGIAIAGMIACVWWSTYTFGYSWDMTVAGREFTWDLHEGNVYMELWPMRNDDFIDIDFTKRSARSSFWDKFNGLPWYGILYWGEPLPGCRIIAAPIWEVLLVILVLLVGVKQVLGRLDRKVSGQKKANDIAM